MWVQKLQLIMLSIFFAGWTLAQENRPNAHFFSLIIGSKGEHCLKQSLDVTEWATIRAGSCQEAALWHHGKNRTLILVAGDETTDLCLTRRQNDLSRSLYVTLCYEGDNDSQSWGFNKKGELLLFSNNRKKNVLAINPNVKTESSSALKVRRRL